MFGKILMKDFKRKKAMNLILFIFMLTAGALIAGSSNLLYSTITAIDYFIEKSNVADLIAVTLEDKAIEDSITVWAKDNKMVKEHRKDSAVVIYTDKLWSEKGSAKELHYAETLILMPQPDKYNLVFDRAGNHFEINKSEVAVPVSVQKKMKLELGDRLTIEINGYQYKLTVKHIFKDVVLGAELMGMKRIIINEADYEDAFSQSEEKDRINFWGFTKNDGETLEALEKSFSDLLLPTFSVMSKNIISTPYIFDLILGVIMIIVSIFLILISFLILRFTIVFTVMEDYKQIGVMKAIGLQNKNIRGMYSVKYLTLSLVAGFLGFLLSLPIARLMKQNISQYILLNNSYWNMVVSFASVVAVVMVTILFCNHSTRKIKRISAIEAIRQGSSGERFKNAKKLKLHRRKKFSISTFLAYSDIINDFKKFVILIIAYILGTAIIIIPNNIITTLSSDGTIKLFGYMENDFYVRKGMMGNQEKAKTRMEELNQQFRDIGIDAKLHADLFSNGKLFTADKSSNVAILCFQGIGSKAEEYDYLQGTAPVLLNEIAITEKIAQSLGLSIGDTVICDFQNETKEYIITGLFQTFNNLGNAIRLTEHYLAENGDTTLITVSGKLKGSIEEKEEQLAELKEAFPDLEIKNGKEVVGDFIGNITVQLGGIRNLVLLLVLGINFLITSLLLRMLISKEVPEIAILKSMGFHDKAVKLWQLKRIGIILLVSIIIGTILANSSGNIISAGVFKIMGVTRTQLMIEPIRVFVVYPVILFAVTMLAAVSSLGKIKTTQVWELNNQE